MTPAKSDILRLAVTASAGDRARRVPPAGEVARRMMGSENAKATTVVSTRTTSMMKIRLRSSSRCSQKEAFFASFTAVSPAGHLQGVFPRVQGEWPQGRSHPIPAARPMLFPLIRFSCPGG